jgi:hypothetical protein
MRNFYLAIVAIAALGIVIIWLRAQIRYRIRSHALEILLFGFRLRQLKFEEIDRISTHHFPERAEKWPNRIGYHRCYLAIKRHNGKWFVITPKFRYEFRRELEKAMADENARPSNGHREDVVFC